MRPGWIGVDLDGTLAQYAHTDTWDGSIGPPVPAMVDRVKRWIDAGIDVRIFTARVAPYFDDQARAVETQRRIIARWCLEHLGVVLPITATKDYGMLALVDDRAYRVRVNSGEFVGDALRLLPHES